MGRLDGCGQVLKPKLTADVEIVKKLNSQIYLLEYGDLEYAETILSA